MRVKNIILTICGFLCLALGAVGIALPIFPTTPFVLIAAACFSASNEKLYKKLAATKYFGAFIQNYKSKSGIEKAVKQRAICFLWATLLISAMIFRSPLVWGILLIVGLAVTTHILMIKSKRVALE